MIDVSYFYFGRVLGCIDADLSKLEDFKRKLTSNFQNVISARKSSAGASK